MMRAGARRRSLRLVAGTAVATLLSGTAVLLSASPAFAANELGFVSVSPTTGVTASRPTFTTTTDCPGSATGYRAKLTGPAGSNWTGQTVLGYTDYTPGAGFFSTQLGDTFSGLAASNSANFTTAGTYNVLLQCVDLTGTVFGDGTAKLVFDVAGANYTGVDAPATTTTVSASPATSATGQSVTLTATVASGTAGFAGTVDFSYANGGGPVSLGSSALSGTTATKTTSSLPVGANTITATFVPNNAGTPTHAFQGSSGTTTATVSVPPTTSTLTINPAGPKYSSTPITLVCGTVGNATNGTPTGTAAFTYTLPGAGSATTSAPVALSGGNASLPLNTLAAGTLSASCAYTPSGASPYAGSTSSVQTTTIQAQDPNTVGTEFLTTQVAAGTLTLTVQGFAAPSPVGQSGTPVSSPSYPYTPAATPTNVVVLADANVNSNGTYIVTAGNIIPVVVIDTRAGDLGYNVTGQLSSFTGAGSHAINAGNLGWTPQFISYNRFPVAASAAAAGLTDGGAVAPGNGLLPTAAAGTTGLAESKVLYTAPAGNGTGTVTYGAAVSLQAPTTTAPDTYTAQLTLTANATP